MTAPARRWFRWSLRTMFVVVTVVCVFVGYHLNWIRQRREAIAHLPQNWQACTQIIMGGSGVPLRRDAPGLLWVFGESGYAAMIRTGIEPDPLEDIAKESELLTRLFPEADIQLTLSVHRGFVFQDRAPPPAKHTDSRQQ